MKTKLMALVIAMVAFSAIHVNAQSDETRIKVLSTNLPGVIKLIHALDTNKPVSVKFITDDGVIKTDEITGSFPKGISKRYDVSRIDKADFLMEISTADLTVTYRIVPSKDRKTFTPYLEKTQHEYDLTVASR